MEGVYLSEDKIPADIHRRQYAEIQYGDDSANHAEFKWDIKKSFFQGDGLFRPNPNDLEGKIGDRILMVTIYSSKRQTVTHRATEEHKRRFPRQYNAFMAGEDQRAAGGTPLEILPFLDKAWIEQLGHCKVFSVEQMLAVDDGRRDELPRGFLAYQRRAKEHMDILTKNAPVAALQHKNDEQALLIAEQTETMKKMASRLEALEDIVSDKSPRGRRKAA